MIRVISSEEPITPEEGYLPLPPIICRQVKMSEERYDTKSWVTTVLMRLRQLIRGK